MRRSESTPTTYVDVMCPERVLVLPQGWDRKGSETVTAKVFWTELGKDGKPTRIFGGNANIPRSLLFSGDNGSRERRPGRYDRRGGDGEQRERIGYMSESSYQKKLEREARDERRVRREDYEE